MYEDVYPTCAGTFATLRVFEVDPDFVTERLRVQPTKTQKRGEHRKTRHGLSSVPHRRDGWFLCSKDCVDSKDIGRHVDWLLEQVLPSAEALRQLQDKGAQTDVFCYWYSASGQGGPSLYPETMSKLGSLRLEIGFDIYFADSDS
jgi:hypothetical protein